MKYYRLTKDLPTFKAGELFFINNYGQLVSNENKSIVAYSAATLKKFPNILEEWFEETEKPTRDINTKTAFVLYLHEHPDERFFQAVRNFARLYLDKSINFVLAGPTGEREEGDDLYADTFYWECDKMLKEGDDETTQ